MPLTPISINSENADNGDFYDTPQLNKGVYLLSLADKPPWVKNRRGYDYGHKRCDLLFIKDKKARNKPISPYNNEWTEVEASYCAVSSNKKQ